MQDQSEMLFHVTPQESAQVRGKGVAGSVKSFVCLDGEEPQVVQSDVKLKTVPSITLVGWTSNGTSTC